MKFLEKLKEGIQDIKEQVKEEVRKELESPKPATPIEETTLSPELDKSISENNFKFAERIWALVLLTLPLDFFILLIQDPPFALKHISDVLEIGMYMLVGICLVFCFRDSWFSMFFSLQSFHKKFHESSRNYLAIFGVLVALAFILVEMSQAKLEDIFSIVVVLITAGIGAYSWYKMLRQTQEYQSRLAVDRQYWLAKTSKVILIIIVIPLGAARLLSFFAALYSITLEASFLFYSLCFAASLLVIVILKPDKSHFLFPCQRCAAWTSRVFSSSSFCPRCEGQLFKDLPALDQKQRCDFQESYAKKVCEGGSKQKNLI